MATDSVTPPAVDAARVLSEHATRVARSESYLVGQDELPKPGLGGQGFEAMAGNAAALGNAVTVRTVLESADATWGPLITHRLRARVAGSDTAAALEALLDDWEHGLAPEPDVESSDRGLVVPWPSRDTAPVAAFTRRGFAPLRATGIKPLGAAGEAISSGEQRRDRVTVRPATTGDLDAMVQLVAEMVAFDAQFGWVRLRPSTPLTLRAQLTQVVGWDGAGWVAEVDGDVVGVVAMQPPSHAGWIGSLVTVSPVAYLAFMSVAPVFRGRAVGAALADRAHAQAREWGAAAVMLHHVLPNPLSTPFWSRQGYRPLLTEWMKLASAPPSRF